MKKSKRCPALNQRSGSIKELEDFYDSITLWYWSLPPAKRPVVERQLVSSLTKAIPYGQALLARSGREGKEKRWIIACLFNLLGQVYFRRRQFAKAVRAQRSAVRYDPDNLHIHESLLEANYASGKYASGARSVNKISPDVLANEDDTFPRRVIQLALENRIFARTLNSETLHCCLLAVHDNAAC